MTSLIPVPRSCVLGDRAYLVSEARLRDIAELQGLLDDMGADPLDGLGEALADDGPDGRRHKLLALYREAKGGKTLYSSREGTDYFCLTAEGAVRLLHVALKRHQPHLTPEDLAAIYRDATPAQFDRVNRVFHGTNAANLLSRLLLGEAPEEKGGGGLTWPEAIDDLARDRGWTYETIYDLTLTEWVNARTNGRPPKPGRKVRPGEDLAALAAQWQQQFGTS